MLRISLVAGFVLASFGALAETPPVNRVSTMLPHCKDQLNQNIDETYNQGKCLGAIQTLMFVSSVLPAKFRFCEPEGTTVNQAIIVVVNFMESQPKRMDDDYRLLALEGMHAAWPCPAGK
jgi:hypothetical protein